MAGTGQDARFAGARSAPMMLCLSSRFAHSLALRAHSSAQARELMSSANVAHVSSSGSAGVRAVLLDHACGQQGLSLCRLAPGARRGPCAHTVCFVCALVRASLSPSLSLSLSLPISLSFALFLSRSRSRSRSLAVSFSFARARSLSLCASRTGALAQGLASRSTVIRHRTCRR